MTKPSIVVWGAGSIGRGFIADLFQAAGYHCVLVDHAQSLIDNLRSSGQFTVVHARGENRCEERIIADYTALHTSETEAIEAAIQHCDLLALAVFPKVFEAAARQLAPHLIKRAAARPGRPLDILLCTNLTQAAPRLRACLQAAMTADEWRALEPSLGLVETLVIRMVPAAPAERRAREPLLVWTNGYPELPVDRNAFKGSIPPVASLRMVEDMHAEEQRKMFTYNMAQAVLGYHGARLGYTSLLDCMSDAAIQQEMLGALSEVSQALQAEYAFRSDEMQCWLDAVVEQVNNPMLGDTVQRICADPPRKLDRSDRLVGAARLAHAHGVPAPALARAIAAALHYREDRDAGSIAIGQKIEASGIRTAVQEICGLGEAETMLHRNIVEAWYRLPLELIWAEKIKKAESLGFQYEKDFHGCGQCSFAAITDTLSNFDSQTFNAATGLSGGLGLVGDSTCSALLGGVLAIGLVYPRTRENIHGARQVKYRNFELTQMLIERYQSHFGSLRCHDIHTHILGRPFDLRSPAEREAFEAAGAHDDKCTTTVALAARWTLELLAESLMEEEVQSRLYQAGYSH